MRARKGPEPLN